MKPPKLLNFEYDYTFSDFIKKIIFEGIIQLINLIILNKLFFISLNFKIIIIILWVIAFGLSLYNQKVLRNYLFGSILQIFNPLLIIFILFGYFNLSIVSDDIDYLNYLLPFLYILLWLILLLPNKIKIFLYKYFIKSEFMIVPLGFLFFYTLIGNTWVDLYDNYRLQTEISINRINRFGVGFIIVGFYFLFIYLLLFIDNCEKKEIKIR